MTVALQADGYGIRFVGESVSLEDTGIVWNFKLHGQWATI